MTLSTIATILGSLAAVVSGLVWLIKQFTKTQEEMNQKIDSSIAKEKDNVSKGGRPDW